MTTIPNIVAGLMYAPVVVAQKILIANVFSYPKETFADSFATLLGYGPELQSALVKFDYIIDENIDIYKIYSEIPLIGHWMGLNIYVFEHFYPSRVCKCIGHIGYQQNFILQHFILFFS